MTNEPSVKRQKRDENELVKYIDPNAEEIIVAQTIDSLGKRKTVSIANPYSISEFIFLRFFSTQSTVQTRNHFIRP